MKKFLAVFLSAVFLVSVFSMQTYAITENEYVQYLNEKGFAQEYTILVGNHLKSYDYTPEQMDTLKDYTNKILDIVMPRNPDVVTKGGDYFDKTKFTNEQEDQILDYVMKASSALGITAVVTRGADSIRYVEFYDKSGKKLGAVTPKYHTLKYTDGSLGNTAVYIGAAALLMMIIAAGVFVAKKNFVPQKIS